MPTLFVDNLTVIDFSYACPQRGIVGASWIVDIVLEGGLDEQGMVFDFGNVKKTIKQHIDEQYDHKLWLNKSLPDFRCLINGKERGYSWLNDQGELFRHRSPTSAVLELNLPAIAHQHLSAHIEQSLSTLLPRNVTAVGINLRDEVIHGANYCYTHGLQKHDGNCQRIAHGHRSRIEISRRGTRDAELEKAWAEKWQDIYIATREHIVSEENGTTRLAYQAPQGEFELWLPSRQVYIIDTESTVENIAAYIHQSLSTEFPRKHISVRAFEGVAKGAIA